MSDTMILGILRMPFDMTSPLELMQIQSRCVEAADRIEADERKILELEDKIKRLRVILVHAAIPLEVLHGQPCKYHSPELNKRIDDTVAMIREIICKDK